MRKPPSWTSPASPAARFLFSAYGVVLIVSSLACGLAGHVGAARLLYCMGRDEVIPKKVFGHLSPRRGNPVYNELIVGVISYVVVLSIPWQRAAEIVTFGALLAFTAVNLAALLYFWFSPENSGQQKVLSSTRSCQGLVLSSASDCSWDCKPGRNTRALRGC